MNIKFTVRNTDSKKVLSCIVDGNQDIERQLETAFGIDHGHGIGVYLREKEVEISDYYHASSMAFFDILFREETTAPVDLNWTDVE